MKSFADLPEELVECLENYCEGRCPEFAQSLLEELELRSTTCDELYLRCTCTQLLNRWLGINLNNRNLHPLPEVARQDRVQIVNDTDKTSNSSQIIVCDQERTARGVDVKDRTTHLQLVQLPRNQKS